MLKTGDIVSLSGGSYQVQESLSALGLRGMWRVVGPDGSPCALRTVASDTDAANRAAEVARIEAEIAALKAPGRDESPFLLPCLDDGNWQAEGIGQLPAYITALPGMTLGRVGVAPDGPTLLRWMREMAHAIQVLPNRLELDPAAILVMASPVEGLRFIPRSISPDRGHSFFAPEQRFAPNTTGTAADLYVLGLLLYGLVCGAESLPQSQGELADEGLLEAHHAEIAQGRVGLLGKVGGLSPMERDRFRRALIRCLGGNPDATLVFGGRRSLPDRDYNAGILGRWLDRMLAPAPEARPTAAELESLFLALEPALAPRIDSLSLAVVPERLMAEETATIELRVEGTGLPTHDRWLSLTLDGRPLSQPSETPQGDYVNGAEVWRYHWTAGLDDEGERHLLARCWLGDSAPHDEASLRVMVSTEQLWQAGRRVEALEREPREEWLDQAERNTDRPEFLAMLRGLCDRYPGNPLLMDRWERLERPPATVDRLEPIRKGMAPLAALFQRYRSILVDGVDPVELADDARQVEVMAGGLGASLQGEIVGYLKDIRAKRVLALIVASSELVLGRGPDVDLVVSGDAVSGQHARLGWDPAKNGFWIEDMRSTNGTWWGRAERLRAGYRYPLESGRTFYLADRHTPLAVFPYGAGAAVD